MVNKATMRPVEKLVYSSVYSAKDSRHRRLHMKRKAGNKSKRNLKSLLPVVSDWFMGNNRLFVIGQLCTPGIFNWSSIDSSYISLSNI